MLDGFRAGDRDALTRVYREHVEEVAALLRMGFAFDAGGIRRRFVGYGSAFELQDALHETFRRAFEPRARDAYDGIRPYGPYLRAIARNVVLRAFRAREIAFPPDGEGAEANVAVTLGAPPHEKPDEALARQQARALVRNFVASLAPPDQELVRLRFEEGLSQRDAADRLEVGRQRVRTREAKIRRRLLAHLRARGEADPSPAAWPLVLGLLTEVLR